MRIDPVTHRPLPTPDDMYSFVASSSAVESSIVARCNTVVVESELRRTVGGYVNNMCNRQPSQIQNPLTTINNTVKPPVWAQVPGARSSCENSLPLPFISMDRLLPPSTSGWLHGFQNEINQDFNSRLNNPIEYNDFSQEALQFSNLERKSEDVADMNFFSGIPNNIKNKTVVFRNRLSSDAETMYDECRPSCNGGTSEIPENAIQYHPDDPFGSSIITARADVLNKGCENNYWYNLLNLIENGMPEANHIIVPSLL